MSSQLPLLAFHGLPEPTDDWVSVDLPTLLETRGLIVGSSRSGKTHTLYDLLQSTFGHVQHFVIDREADYVALRAAYPYVVVGGEGDLPISLGPGAVEALTRELLRLKLSAIFDLSDVDEDERLEFSARLCRTMADLPRSSGLWTPCLVVIDEAHHYAPEKGEGGDGAEHARKAVASLASRGAKRGFCLIAATQRLASLSKAVSSLCENRLVLRTGPEDLKRAADALGKSRAIHAELRTLDRGTGYAYGPAISTEPVLVRIHSELRVLPPRRGELRAPPSPAPDAVKRLLAEPPAAVDAVEHDAADLDAARARIRQIEAELRAQRSATDPTIDQLRAQVNQLQAATRQFQESLQGMRATILQAVDEVLASAPAPTDPAQSHPQNIPQIVRQDALLEKRASSDRPRAQQALLDTAARLKSIGLRTPTRAQLAVLAGMSPKSSATERHYAALIRDELLDVAGPGCVALTCAGECAAEPVLIPPTLAEYHDAWRRMLKVPSQLALFNAMVHRPVLRVSRAQLAVDAGISATSSATERAFAWLISLDLLSKRAAGEVAAGPLLFPEGLS